MTLILITLAVLGLGYWSAYMRIAQSGGEALPVQTKVFLGILGGLFAFLAANVISGPSVVDRAIAEFFVLCFGQCLGYILTGK